MRRMALGVDLGWVSQLEQMGYSWVNEAGEKTDPILLSGQMGADSVRLRIFVNPPEDGFWQKRADERCMLGFCDAKSVLETAERVKKLDMNLMLDFHYSDHFADPLFQDIPQQWENSTAKELEQHVYEHTAGVLKLFRENGIIPEWVQVGNEINPGILLPCGGLKEAPKQLVRFLNCGYDAVKEVCPETKVITHMAEVNSEESCVPFLDNFFANEGKTDILGFSYYPYWYHSENDKELLYQWLKRYHDKYMKPVMITEVGGEDSDETGTYNLLRDCIEAVERIPKDQGLGVFYWEPEVNREILPDKYPLGAARLAGEKQMSGILTEDLIYEILSVVEEIPEGKVASYGQIAKLIGRDKNARLVGKVLSMAEYYGEYPCHRVVNHAGRLAPFFHEQRDLLLEEGVTFKDKDHVDMKKCRWEC